MTTYPLNVSHRTATHSRRITIPAPTGVPEVDGQVDVIAALQGRVALAEKRERDARDAVRDVGNAARQRLIASMSTDDEPDLSGDVEVTKAEMVHEAARRITTASQEALAREVSRFFAVLTEHRAEVRHALWRKAEKARDTLAGAAYAAERAQRELAVSAGLVAGLDRYADGSSLATFVAAPYGGNVQVSQAATTAQEALALLGEWMEKAWQPAPKGDGPADPADERPGVDFDEEIN